MLIAMAAAETLSPYIEFKDVSKAFGDVVVLKNVSFEVLPGEMVCILGRSGVGKSVSLHNIMGFLKPDSGRRKPMMLWSDTDLPTPLRPRMQTISPGSTSKLTFLRTTTSPNALETSLNSM